MSVAHLVRATSYLTPRSFLNDSDRIAARGYDPTDADIVRARLRTVGVQEHKFMFEVGACDWLSRFACVGLTFAQDVRLGKNCASSTLGEPGAAYVALSPLQSASLTLVDVQRASWYPYFDDGKHRPQCTPSVRSNSLRHSGCHHFPCVSDPLQPCDPNAS